MADSGSIESLIGDIQEKRGDPLAAVHGYQTAVTLEPSEESYHVALGLELLRHQTFDAALVVFKQASTLFPQSLRVKILLGLAYYFVDRSLRTPFRHCRKPLKLTRKTKLRPVTWVRSRCRILPRLIRRRSLKCVVLRMPTHKTEPPMPSAGAFY